MDKAFIHYQNVEICYREHCILENVNLELQKGDFAYLTGKVGSGKTSLLKTFYGELQVTSGHAEVLGYDMCRIKRRHIPSLRRRLGIVFQDFQLLTDRIVYDNLDFVLRATGWNNPQKREERIHEVLQQVGMEHKGYKWPLELSGGEQQRIAIARALLNSPEIILADEPTGNLDMETGQSIIDLLYAISKKGTLVLITTHNLLLMQRYPGKLYRCNNHQVDEMSEGGTLPS